MSLKNEYKKQQEHRNWKRVIEKIPLKKEDIVLDLGCGTGDFSVELSKSVKKIICVDKNKDLLMELEEKNVENIDIFHESIESLDFIRDKIDGIFSSFTIAYFPNNLNKVLEEWTKKLKKNGWIAIIEIDDLLRGHGPLSKKTDLKLEKFEKEIKNEGFYNFKCGRELERVLRKLNIEILINEDLEDDELTSKGVLKEELYDMWKNRLNRLSFQKVLSEKEIEELKVEFLSLLKNPKHENTCVVKLIIGLKK